MNTVQLTGRLTTDPQQRSLPSGESVCTLRLAVERMGRSQQTGYVNVAVFGKSGDAAARVLGKGWLVAVDGRLEHSQWETDDGTKRHDYTVIGNVEFLTAPHGQAEPAQPQQEPVAF